MAKREEERRKFRWLFLMGMLLCFALSFTVNASTKDARADYSASKLYSYNGHTYQLVYEKLSWAEAESYAEKLDGHLATVTTAKEQSFLAAKVRQNGSSYTGNYWLGATDEENEGTWKWVTGEKFRYSNWDTGEPNSYGGDQDYLKIYGVDGIAYGRSGEGTPGKWDDGGGASSSPKWGFIIEWEYGLTVEDKLLEFEVGDTGMINYSASGSGTVSFKSSDTSVAKVSSKGKVIAKGSGVCKITVKFKGASQTVAVVVTPRRASSLTRQSVTAKMVQLKWKSLSGVSGYQVWMYDPDVEEYVKVKTTGQTTATITGLDRGTTYKFKVRAYVKYGKKYYYGSYSKGITVTTKK